MGVNARQQYTMGTRSGLEYMVFAQEVGPMVKARYPLVEKVQYNQILARIWKGLSDADRSNYRKKARKTFLSIVNTHNNTDDHHVIKQDI